NRLLTAGHKRELHFQKLLSSFYFPFYFGGITCYFQLDSWGNRRYSHQFTYHSMYHSPVKINGLTAHQYKVISSFLGEMCYLAGDEQRIFRERVDAGGIIGSYGQGFSQGRLRICFRSEEHTSELQSRENLVCRLLLDKKKTP